MKRIWGHEDAAAGPASQCAGDDDDDTEAGVDTYKRAREKEKQEETTTFPSLDDVASEGSVATGVNGASASASLVAHPSPSISCHAPQLQRLLETHKVLPRLIIVDLDYTLWPGFVIDKGTPISLSAASQDEVVFRPRDLQSPTRTFGLYPEARQVLMAMKAVGTTLAVASRSPDAKQAETVLRLMGLLEHFSSLQVYRDTTKRPHLTKIAMDVSIRSHETLFLDDEAANIKVARKLGVCAFQVTRRSGLDWQALEGALKAFKADAAGRTALAGFFHKPKAKEK